MLISDGDVSGVIATSRPDSGVDIYLGSGGAPEGVLAAAALRCIGGQMQGRLLFRNDDERARAKKWGVTDLNRKYGMLNTKTAVAIAYTAFNLPFATWMMKSYFQDLPVELEEAAIVDGDTRWGAFLRIALPLARPGLAATAIFCLIVSWNEFLLALILTLTARSQTLPIGIAGRVTQYTTYWGEISAAGFMACIPIMVFAFIVQKHLVRGLSFGAVKG